jgi:uncharacterized protein YhbP (UPF0306 family)
MTKKDRQFELIASLLRGESTLAVATVDERGGPCVAPLFYIADAELNLYWFSSAESGHSRNLHPSATVSATVFHHTENWKEIRGVQMRGEVEAVADAERRSAVVKQYCERFRLGRVLQLAIRRSTLYVFRPEWFRYTDNAKHFGYKFELTL